MRLNKEEAEALNEVTKLIAKYDSGEYKHLLKHLDAIMTKYEKDLSNSMGTMSERVKYSPERLREKQ